MNTPRPLWLLLVMALGVTAVRLWGGALSAASPAVVLIDSVLFDGYALNDADEAVRLVNVGDSAVELGGWRLSDGTSSAALPPVMLAPGAMVWLTGNAEAFREQFGHDADVALKPWPGFSNAGDEVLLLDADGRPVDALVYLGGNTGLAGWQGSAVEPYRVSGLFAAEGQVLYRKRDQATGRIVSDTDSAADWAQETGSAIDGRKVRYPGWETERFFFPAVITATATLTIAVAPDNAFVTLRREVDSADTSIRLSSLMLENVAFGEALATAARRGVEVTILLEGSPPGGITDQERFVCDHIEKAGGACWFMIADSDHRIHDRYRFMHAKYMVIDDRVAAIGSENFSPDSLPDDDKSDGTWGRRGVFLLTDAPGVAAHLAAVFADDLDTAHSDIRRWSAADPVYGAPPPGFVPVTTTGGDGYAVRFPAPLTIPGVHAFEIVQSPENALRDVDGLLGLIGRAGQGDRLLIQQLSERPYWGTTSSNPTADPNPRLETAIAAARRGATVRLMLDSFFEDPSSPVGNAATCAYVNGIGRAERLSLRCELGNPTGLGIHNKMVLARIDGRGYVHVGSINGTELSNKGNREMALQMQSDEAYAYLAGMFLGDVERVAYLPLAMANFRGAANHVLISEIVYDTTGPDEAEFVELYNPTGLPVDMNGYGLSDAVYQTDFEDMRLFPPGVVIRPYGTLVVTISAAAFRAEFGASPDLEIVDSDPAVPDMIDDPAWGDPEALFQLANSGDEVLLWRIGLLDVVTYGDGYHSAVVGCPLLVPPARSLQRDPYWDDTDNCPRDFRGWPFSSPGRVP